MIKKYQIGILLSFVMSLFVTVNVGAAVPEISENDNIYQKVIYTGVYTCYNSPNIVDGKHAGLLDTITLNNFHGLAGEFFADDGHSYQLDNIVPIINKVNDKNKEINSHIDCKTLLTEKTAKKLGNGGKQASGDEKIKVLESALYSPSGTVEKTEGQMCYSYPYVKSPGNGPNKVLFTPEVCIGKNTAGEFVVSSINNAIEQDDESIVSFEGINTSTLHMKIGSGLKKSEMDIPLNANWDSGGPMAGIGYNLALFMPFTDQYVENNGIYETFDGNTEVGHVAYYAYCTNYKEATDHTKIECNSTASNLAGYSPSDFNVTFANQMSGDTVYRKIGLGTAANDHKLISTYSEGKYTYDGLKFSDDEIYTLYRYYLEKIYGVTNTAIKCGDVAQTGVGDQIRLWWAEESKYSEYCYVSVDSDKAGINVNGVDKLTRYFGNEISFEDLRKQMNGLNNTEPPVSPEMVDPNANSSVSNGDACKTTAKSLGWIVCPVLNFLSESATNLYNDYVKPSLQIKPQLFTGTENGDNGTLKAWQAFQNIANVLFVILFLIVIFSQLTGVGIDNYGIKKILPKLIIVAVLMNLSYYVCELCVDVSNIAGNGIQALFDNMPPQSVSAVVGSGDAATSVSAVAGTMTTVSVLAGLLAAGWAIVINPAILLSLLVSVIGILISIFFLFILLSMRQAAVVVLVVISPLAFLCYALPNTKKLFDKWIKIGEALLLLYPICGLLVGGGDFVSRLLLNINGDGNFFIALTAMIVGIAPIFFIPTVLKTSFAAMGNIGAKISGVGAKVRSGVTKGARGTDAYKNAQERSMERRTRIRAGVDADGNVKKVGVVGRFMRGGNRGIAKARAQYLKDRDADKRVEALTKGDSTGYAAALIGQEKKFEKEELADYMTLINNETRNGENEEALFKMYDDYISKGNKSGAVAVARIAGRRKDTAARFLDMKVTGRGYRNKETGEWDEMGLQNMRNMNASHGDIFGSVAKEISTGENSSAYRESTPIGFEFAAQYNRNNVEGGEPITQNYQEWVGQKNDKGNFSNVNSAMENYITNSRELVGTKGSSLREINELMKNNQMDKNDINRLRILATETIANRDKGPWDSTKAAELCAISGQYTYDPKTGQITQNMSGDFNVDHSGESFSGGAGI